MGQRFTTEELAAIAHDFEDELHAAEATGAGRWHRSVLWACVLTIQRFRDTPSAVE